MKENGLVAIIIVTWNNEKDIVDCINSINSQTFNNFKIIVVDNASKDSTVKLVQGKFPEVDLIKLGKNLYFTGGNNYGFKYAKEMYNPDFYLVLNPDTIVDKDLLAVLLDKISQDKNIGAIGPKILFKGGENDGKINSSSLFYDGFHSAYDQGFKEEDRGQYDQTKEVFAVTGTCILFRKELIEETKGFWNILKMYTDEIELFIRSKKLGFKVIYTGETKVHHKYRQSSSQSKTIDFERLKMRNWLLIALRHYSLRDKLRMLRDYIKFIY